MCLREQLRTTLIMPRDYHGDRAKSREVSVVCLLEAGSPDRTRSVCHLRYAPTFARTSARKKRSMNSMNSTDGTSRISAVIEVTW
jgi:hypothetical protein